MTKIIGYKLKDSFIERHVEIYDRYRKLCSVQEYFSYMLGIPLAPIQEYLDANKIEYDCDFIFNEERGRTVIASILTKDIEAAVVRKVYCNCNSKDEERLICSKCGKYTYNFNNA